MSEQPRLAARRAVVPLAAAAGRARAAPRATRPVLQKYEDAQLRRRVPRRPAALADVERRRLGLRDVGAERGARRVRAAAGQGRRAGGQARQPLRAVPRRRGRRAEALPRHAQALLPRRLRAALRRARASRRATRDDVCEAGFVVRRRLHELPARRRERGRRRRSSSRSSRAPARAGEARAARRRAKRALRRCEALAGADTRTAPSRCASGELRLALERERKRAARVGGRERRAAGAPSAGSPSERRRHRRVAAVVEDEPADAARGGLPALPARPGPGATRRTPAAARRSTSASCRPGAPTPTPRGAARFDDGTLYEIRCFVRRHTPRCPQHGRARTTATASSSGAGRPSRSGSPPHFDLGRHGATGRSTIQLPDLPALAAAGGARSPVGALAPGADGRAARLVAEVRASDVPPTRGQRRPTAQICSFAIPLITIVAMFVLNLFLPIVVFALRPLVPAAAEVLHPAERRRCSAGVEAQLARRPASSASTSTSALDARRRRAGARADDLATRTSRDATRPAAPAAGDRR